MLEDKIQKPGNFLFRFSRGSHVLDQEVEMVESVDDLESSRSSRSIEGYTHFPNFEMLDAGIASALNKIIPNSHFKKRRSVSRNRMHRKRIGSNEEDRSLT